MIGHALSSWLGFRADGAVFFVWQGILDDQFSQLQMLQDESTPDFMEEVVTLFFDDSVKLLENLTESLYVFST
jgi:hypothetical protein